MRLKLSAVVMAAFMACACVVGTKGLPAQDRPVAAIAAAAESPDSAKQYFDRARKLGFPAAGSTAPYVLQAEFTTRGSLGVVETGTYTDTWVSDTKWRREAVLGTSRFVRSRNGRKRYRLDEGPDAALLQFVLTAMEPIPNTDSLRDSDWKIRRDTVDDAATVRVSRGRDNPDGTPDPKQFEGYWFDGNGQLVKTFLNALQTRRTNFASFNGVQVARRVEVLLGGQVGMRIDVTSLGPAGEVDPHIFAIKRHEWLSQSASESEVR
jgi:hypothetical protein